jgi:hypothetical protein
MGVRVVLDPKARRVASGLSVIGAIVRLERFGPGPEVEAGEHPAALHVHAGFLETARPRAQPEFSVFAHLAGTLDVKDGEASFRVPANAEWTYEEDAPESPLLPRVCELSFAAESFTLEAVEEAPATPAPVTVAPVTQLRLPLEPPKARYLEVGVELEVAGALVAPLAQNDKLDVPLLGYARITLLDGDDLPLGRQRFAIQLGTREVSVGLLDDEGSALAQDLPSVHCRVTFPDLEPQTDLRRTEVTDVPEDLR